MIFLMALLVGGTASAATLFSDSASYPVKAEWQEPAPTIQMLGDARYESTMDYTSFDAGSDKPSFSNQTQQRVRWKKLPASIGEDKFELLYEDYRTRSKVQVFPGMAPMDTSQDFGIYLSSKPLKLSGHDGQPTRIDNLEAVKKQLGSEVKDPAANQALQITFQENILLDSTRSFLQENSCLRELSKKAVGATWRAEFVSPAMKIGFDCKLEGWAEAGANRVMVIGVTIPRITQETKLPMGRTASVETEGSGKLYFDPKSRESMARVEMNISQLAGGKGAKGLSKLKSVSHAVAP
ncbi:MAG: hypothetical protein ACXWQO_05775 [Bdellovibrionota bacterium]